MLAFRHHCWGVLKPYDAPPCDVRAEVVLTSLDVSLGASGRSVCALVCMWWQKKKGGRAFPN